MTRIKLIRNTATLEVDCVLKAHAAGSTLCTIAIKREKQSDWTEIGDISYHKKAKHHIFIEDIHIEKNYQRQGFGTLLIEKLQSKYRHISLYSTKSAETFWRKVGFVDTSNAPIISDQFKLSWQRDAK